LGRAKSTKDFEPIYDVIKTLKLQCLLNGMRYEGDWPLIGKEIRYGM